MRFIFIFLVIIALSSCNTYNKLLKSEDPEKKLEAAMQYFESGSYFRTIQLLENILATYRGSVQAEKIYYYYAYSHYHQGDYIVAAFHFSSLAKTLPNSQYAEEALYMSAYCKYLYSPDFFLDQSSTREAMNEMQLFINKYPKSERVAKANEIIDEMRAKIELKAFENAKMYVKLEEYQAAVVALQNVIRDFPGTNYTEEAMFLIVKSWYLYAVGSVPHKQQERFEKAKDAYQEFVADFPNSNMKNEASFYYNASIKNIDSIKNAKPTSNKN